MSASGAKNDETGESEDSHKLRHRWEAVVR
ncbi:hypothetical protein SAMN05444682_107211 [Parapedobacter indicus]|uniref:Uncharacterized protein n=1 Tax=Parapedobacter indicus TaxID=1477437 RepID=A0A1I3NI57_9SPHI|nr:hypothetical protein CLV26_107211 [Parapedobacter indicus]SFJ08852.1 hypothetical protein SAMN05444682_107211 [Parapedobacter indicus]